MTEMWRTFTVNATSFNDYVWSWHDMAEIRPKIINQSIKTLMTVRSEIY